MSEDLKAALKSHMESDMKLFEKLGESLDKIKDNHLYHIEKDSAMMQADIDWLKKFFFIVATSSTGSLGIALINLIFRK